MGFEDRTRHDGLENSAHRFYSVYRGTVTSVRDPERRGRIKVRCDLFGSDELAQYAEPLAPFAGPGYGVFFPPQVNQHVWLLFEHGDMSIPYYLGGWWGDVTGGAPELPKEVHDRVSPASTRIIKVPSGHAIIFEDGIAGALTPKKRVEIRTADQTYPPGAEPETTVRHQLVLSDTDELIELASSGEDKNTPGVKRHKITLDDKTKKVRIETGQGHIIELDGTTGAEKISITTKGQHKFVMDDTLAKPSISLETKGKSKLVLDDTPGKQQINITTPQQRQVLLDDTGPGAILVKDPTGNIVTAGPTGIQVTSAAMVNVQAAGACTVTAAGAVAVQGAGVAQAAIGGPTTSLSTGAVTSLFLGIASSIIVGLVSAIILGGLALIVPGIATLTAGTIALISGSIALGTGTQFALLNANLLVWLSTHTHLSAAPGAPTGPPVQALQLTDPTLNTVYMTQNVTGS